MNKMKWNSDEQAYFGECSDGATVRVEGDEWSESVADCINTQISDRGIDREALTVEQDEALIEELREAAENELDEPDMWGSLAGDNPNVSIVED